jgi:hypothetical protein
MISYPTPFFSRVERNKRSDISWERGELGSVELSQKKKGKK